MAATTRTPQRLWTEREVRALVGAVEENPKSEYQDIEERWRSISSAVSTELGTRVGKNECYAEYKFLKHHDMLPWSECAADKFTMPSQSSSDDESKDVEAPAPAPAPSARADSNLGVDEEELDDIVVDDDDDPTLGWRGGGAAAAVAAAAAASGDRGPNAGLGAQNEGPIRPGRELSLRERNDLRRLLFGSEKGAFPSSWQEQGLYFNARDTEQAWGLVQRSGGPCGALACIQAYVLKSLLFASAAPKEWQDVDVSDMARHLVHALCEILWTVVGRRQRAVICTLKPGASLAAVTRKMDGIEVHEAASMDECRRILISNLDVLTTPTGAGVLLTAVAALLTRGLPQVRDDMGIDTAQASVMGSNTLLDRHGYSSQEFVNLLLTGVASTQVFDGVQELSGEGDDRITLRGVESRGIIGFLTLFEAYENVAVGRNLKTPHLPIWVVCSESHYSVLFQDFAGQAQEQDASSPHFLLFYYDGLDRSDELIRLTVEKEPAEAPPTTDAPPGVAVPPLDLVIRTKWKGAKVEWSVEPIL